MRHTISLDAAGYAIVLALWVHGTSPVGIGPCVDRISHHTEDAFIDWQFPHDVSALWTVRGAWQGNSLLPQPAVNLMKKFAYAAIANLLIAGAIFPAAAQVTVVNQGITESEVLAAQQAWCKALVDISAVNAKSGQAEEQFQQLF